MSNNLADLAALIDDEAELETARAAAQPAEKNDGDGGTANVCRHCGAPRVAKYPMCRQCGFYETLNTFVEVDQIDVDGEIVVQRKPVTMPFWAWVLIGVLLLILIESVAVTLVWPVNSLPRMIWSLSQLALGLILALVAHGRATFIAIMENSENEIGDCIIRPLRIWACVSAELPRTLPWVAMGSGGFLALLLSVLLIRSIPYNMLFETDAPPPKAKKELAGAIAAQAKKEEAEDMSMEDAVKGLAGNATEELDLKLPTLREKSECVIVGYYAPDGDQDQLSSILVAGANGKKLEILGTISLDIDEKSRASLNKKLRLIPRKKPFVETTLSARWVQPIVLCEISFVRNKKGDLNDLKFEKVTGTSTLPEKRQ